jgi:hypothetical protein
VPATNYSRRNKVISGDNNQGTTTTIAPSVGRFDAASFVIEDTCTGRATPRLYPPSARARLPCGGVLALRPGGFARWPVGKADEEAIWTC